MRAAGEKDEAKEGVEVMMARGVEKNEEELLGLPNVTGVGVGEKGGHPVIVVFVTRKVPLSQLRPNEAVPRKLDGYRTDVEAIGTVTAREGRRRRGR